MNSGDYEQLLRARQRGELKGVEQERLAALLQSDPKLGAEWQEDVALQRLLKTLPEAPLSSNFTSLVMQQLHRDDAAPQTPSRWALPRFWVRGLAYGSLALFVGVGTMYYRTMAGRFDMANSVATVTTVAQLVQPVAMRQQTPVELPPMPPVDIWENFEEIRRLPDQVDTELLLALE